MGKSNKLQKSKMEGNLRDRYLLIGFLAIILLHVLGGFWHSYYSWGFSYWSVVSNKMTLLFGAIAFVGVIITYSQRTKIRFGFIKKFQSNNQSKSIVVLFSILITIIIGFILYLFRSKAHVYGDGYSILEFCSTDSPIEFIDQYRLQFFAVYWHQFMFKILSPIGYFEKENIFALTNAVGGVLGLWGVYKISGLLARNVREKLFFVIIALSSASIILFFGYIENYTWAMSVMLWSIYYCIRYVNNKSSIFPLLTSSLIGFAFHMITMPVLATVLFAVLYKAEKTKQFLLKLKKTYLVGYVLLGSLLILLVAQLKGLDVFVPLWELSKNNYSLFSPNHLSDIVNLLLLLAPLGLFFFLVSLKSDKNAELKNDSTEKILFMFSLLTFLSACVIDPHLGMLRDWDLFSFYGIPLTLWGGYRFIRMYSEKQFPNWIIVASSIIMLVHIVPNVYEKNHPQIAVEYLDTVLWEDPHYQTTYNDAYRGLSWAIILEVQMKRSDLVEKYYSRRASVEKNDATPLYNLGIMYFKNAQYDSARYFYQKGLQITPNAPRFLAELSVVETSTKNYALGEKYAKKALSIDSNYLPALTAIAILCAEQKRIDESLIYFRRAYELNPNNFEQNIHLGMLYSRGVNIDSAYYYMNKSLLLAPKEKKSKILSSLISITLYMNLNEKAIEYLNQLKSIDPNSPIVKIKEKEIYGK